MRKYFRPELLNRIDEQIAFDILSEESIRAIARLRIGALQAKLLKERALEVEVADDAVSVLSRLGYDERNGARELNRVIERLLEAPLSEMILAGELKRGARVVVRGGADKLRFEEEVYKGHQIIGCRRLRGRKE